MSKQRDFRSLASEMLEILWSLYLIKRVRLTSDDEVENLRELKFLDLLSRDIILRLCKFRDDDTRNLSFDQVWKSQRKMAARKAALEGVEDDIRRFDSLTKDLHKHRSSYVAHLAKQAPDLSPPIEVIESSLLALEIIDRLLGEPVEYSVSRIDLRRSAFEAQEA